MNPRQRALEVLCLRDPTTKAHEARALFASLDSSVIDPEAVLDAPPDLPGRPARPTWPRWARCAPAPDW